jgi:hypothetical protein
VRGNCFYKAGPVIGANEGKQHLFRDVLSILSALKPGPSSIYRM